MVSSRFKVLFILSNVEQMLMGLPLNQKHDIACNALYSFFFGQRKEWCGSLVKGMPQCFYIIGGLMTSFITYVAGGVTGSILGKVP